MIYLYIMPGVCQCIDLRCEDDAYANCADYLYIHTQRNYGVFVRPDNESDVMHIIAQ